MNRLAACVFGVGLAIVPACAHTQNTPTSTPASAAPAAGGNELLSNGAVGTNVADSSGWHRYLPSTAAGWGALLIGVSAAASLAWWKYDIER